ncbi:cytochrome P450 [Phlyctochytrium arcticum]|nr:cytochrome P450 [Phlyctochytrium arcticum]
MAPSVAMRQAPSGGAPAPRPAAVTTKGLKAETPQATPRSAVEQAESSAKAFEKKQRTDWLLANGLPVAQTVSSIFLLPFRLWNAFSDRITGASARTVTGFPYIGSLLSVAMNPPLFVEQNNKTYGQPFRFGFNGRKMLSISDPETIHKLLMNEESLVQMWWDPRTFLKLMGPTSVFTLHGDDHMRMRQILLRSFNQEALIRLYPEFQSGLRSILGKMATNPEGSYPSEELGGFMYRHLMRFIGGSDPSSLQGLLDLEADYHVWAAGLGAIVPYPLPFTALRKGLDAREKIVEGVQKVIRLRTTVRAKGHIYDDALGDWLSGPAPDGLDGVEIPDQVLALQFGGRLALTNIMCSIMHIVAQEASNNDIAALRDELSRAGAPDLSWEQIAELPILDMWLKECFRMHQPTGLLFRNFVTDMSVAGRQPGTNGAAKQCPVAKGDLAMLSLGASFHDPKVFGPPDTELDPARFNPRRWLNPSKESKAFFTNFGLGKRSCVGYLLATMTAKTFIAELVSNYDVKQRGATRVFGFPAYVNEPWAVLRRR